jgi:two-component system, NtrC family, response regulator AtoC
VRSRSLVELPPQDLIFGRFSTVSTIRRTAQHGASTNMSQHPQTEISPGKEIPARFIYRQDQWANGAFSKVSCPAMLEALLGSELSGHGKGSFSKNHGTKAKWREPHCGQVDESIGNLGCLDSVS